jgi:hypothetical protein
MVDMTQTVTPGPALPTATTASIHAADGWSPRTWLLLVVLCGALFLDGLDV